jgi:hypothetical protein
MAVTAENIDEAKVEEARRRVEARLHEKIPATEIASVNAALALSLHSCASSDASRAGITKKQLDVLPVFPSPDAMARKISWAN